MKRMVRVKRKIDGRMEEIGSGLASFDDDGFFGGLRDWRIAVDVDLAAYLYREICNSILGHVTGGKVEGFSWEMN